MDNAVFELFDRLRLELAENPEIVREVLDEHPEWKELLAKYLDQFQAGVSVSLPGFKVFYQKIFNRELPKIQEPIVLAFVRAYEEKSGAMEECWRGFGKSTLLIAWAAYVIGVRPVGSTALVRINDTKAKEAGRTIAEIIETNPGWKEIFSHVVPDKDAGWSGESGYHVRDTRVANDGEWLQMCFADHLSEPSLACGGVESGIIIGMHPTNGMWIDDLHDEDNTRSALEMQKVVDILKGNIISTWFSTGTSPAIGVACTPWSERDSYVEMLKTGLFEKVTIPIFVRDIPKDHPATELWEYNEKKYGRKYFDPYDQEVVLTWPEAWPIEKITRAYNANVARFGQMYLLDLSTLKGLTLKKEWLGEYELAKVGENWPTFFGIDFASTTDKLGVGDTDYFTLAIGKAIPSGGVVMVGGYRARLPMHEAISKVQALSNLHQPVAIGIEKFGSGRQFIETLVYQTRLPIVPLPYKGAPVKSKGQKFENVLGTDFANGRIWIVDAKDEFIKAFCDEWVSWDGTLQKSRTGHDDTLDAVYYLREIALGHVIRQPAPGAGERRRKKLSPFATVGSVMNG